LFSAPCRFGGAGFTLLEMLIVLFIFGIVTAIAPPVLFPLEKKLETVHFLQGMEEDLFRAQQHAINRKVPVAFQYKWRERGYELNAEDGSFFMYRPLPDGVEIEPGNMGDFRFLPNGNISRFGYMYIHAGGRSYRIFFSIGRGRMEVYEDD